MPSLPQVMTLSFTKLDNYGNMTFTGSVLSDGGSKVTDSGAVYSSTNNMPTLSDSVAHNGSGTGTIIAYIMQLKVGVTYYARAYATNSVGTSYGSAYSAMP